MMRHQQLFEQVLTDEPPARDTLDTLVRRSRRRLRGRRVTTAGAGLAAAAVVAVLVLPGTAPPAVTGAPPTTVTSAPDRASGVLLGADPTESPNAAVARLKDAVPAAVTAVVPTATVLGQRLVMRDVLPSVTGADPGSPAATISYQLTADVTVGAVTGTLVVTIKRRNRDDGCTAAFHADVLPSVVRSECPSGGAGEPYTLETVKDEQLNVVRYVVWLNRPDGTAVGVSVSNEPALTGALPLTGDQILDIARDARLTLYP